MQPIPSAGTIAALALALAFTACAARAAEVETFDGAQPSNSAYASGVIPGTSLEVVSGYAYIVDDGASHGHFLDLVSGWYSSNYDATANVGYSTVRSTGTWDLLAGVQYTLQFDYSRQTFSAGNGPFDTSLIASLGNQSTTFTDVAGFYYGFDWQAGTLTFTPQADQLGAHVSFTASGPAGYAGMAIDNVSLVATALAVPEPASGALFLGALGLLALRMRRTAKQC